MRKRLGLALIAAVLLVQGPMGRAGLTEPARYVGTYVWRGADKWFGGFSGLEVSADGSRFTVLSDRGHYATGTFARDAAGAVTGATIGPLTRVLGPNGKRMPMWKSDSEGLAITPDGRTFISYEGTQRVLEYDAPGAPAHVLPSDPDFRHMVYNGSLEALAVDGSGALYTLPEVGTPGQPITVYRYANGHWTHPFTIPRIGNFRPVGADFGPDGRLYLLERKFAGIFGFASRVRRLTLGPRGLVRSETLLQTPTGTHDNLEGLAVWRDRTGTIRLTMVADDNFSLFQRTEVVDYAVKD